jgi:hypothetical protein
LIAWLYFSRLDNQEALDKIKRKLSAGHKKLHWIKTADSKGNKVHKQQTLFQNNTVVYEFKNPAICWVFC